MCEKCISYVVTFTSDYCVMPTISTGNQEQQGRRHLEIMPPVSGLERCPVCHPERSEGSGEPDAEILSAAKDDRPYLQMSMLHRQGFSKVAFMQRQSLCMLLF